MITIKQLIQVAPFPQDTKQQLLKPFCPAERDPASQDDFLNKFDYPMSSSHV